MNHCFTIVGHYSHLGDSSPTFSNSFIAAVASQWPDIYRDLHSESLILWVIITSCDYNGRQMNQLPLRILLVFVPLFYVFCEGAEPRHILDRRDDLHDKIQAAEVQC